MGLLCWPMQRACRPDLEVLVGYPCHHPCCCLFMCSAAFLDFPEGFSWGQTSVTLDFADKRYSVHHLLTTVYKRTNKGRLPDAKIYEVSKEHYHISRTVLSTQWSAATLCWGLCRSGCLSRRCSIRMVTVCPAHPSVSLTAQASDLLACTCPSAVATSHVSCCTAVHGAVGPLGTVATSWGASMSGHEPSGHRVCGPSHGPWDTGAVPGPAQAAPCRPLACT